MLPNGILEVGARNWQKNDSANFANLDCQLCRSYCRACRQVLLNGGGISIKARQWRMQPIPIDQTTPITMTIAEVTRRTGIGRTSVFEAIRLGKLRAVKAGARTLIKSEDLKAFLDALPDARAGKAA